MSYFNSSQLCMYIRDNWIYAMNATANSFQQPVFPKHQLTPTTTAEKHRKDSRYGCFCTSPDATSAPNVCRRQRGRRLTAHRCTAAPKQEQKGVLIRSACSHAAAKGSHGPIERVKPIQQSEDAAENKASDKGAGLAAVLCFVHKRSSAGGPLSSTSANSN